MGIVGMILNATLLRATVRLSTPISLAAMAAVLTQQAGILNIGLEGAILLPGFVAVAVSFSLHSSLLGLLAAIGAGVFLSLILAVVSLKFRADVTVAGIAINLLGAWVTRLLLKNFFHTVGSFYSPEIVPLPTVHIPFLERIWLLDQCMNGFSVIDYAAIVLVFIVYGVLFKTPWGLRMRAVGVNPLGAEAAGINVLLYRYTVLALSGVLTGMAGAHLGLGYTTLFSEGMSGGRGFMGLAAMFFGGAMPFKSWFASLVFGFCDALGARLQVFGFPSQFLLMLPYVATVVALGLGVGHAARVRRVHQARACNPRP